MRRLLPIGCLVFALAGAAHGQTPRLRFIDLPSPDRAIMGRITLRVSDDPITRPPRSRVVIRLDGGLIAECYRLPLELAWETGGIEDGRHLLQLVLLEERGGRTIDRILDEHTITIRSRVKPSHPTQAEPKPEPKAEPRTEPKPDAREAAPPKRDPAPLAEPPRKEKSKRPDPQPASIIPESRREEERKPPVEVSADLATLNATTLCLNGRKLCIGLADGSVAIYDTADRKAVTVAGPAGAGETRAVAWANGTVWWLTAPTASIASAPKKGGPAIPAVVQVPQLCAYRIADGSLQTYDVSAVGARFEPKQILLWAGKVALVAGSEGVILDPKSGEFRDLDETLPREAVRVRQHGGTLRLAADGATAVAAAIESAEGGTSRTLRLWRSRGGDWTGGGAQTVEVPAGGITSVGLTTSEVTLLSPEGVTTIAVSRGGELRFAPLPTGVPAIDGHAQTASAGADTWWLRGSTLFHADGARGTLDALFPWNVKGMQPRALATDRDGAWVATSAGVRRVVLDAPDAESGYGGFVRARLGVDTTESVGPSEQKLAAAIESWQGTPYVWGGETRKGVDCSGFVMVAFREAGIDLPHGSDNLRGYEEGLRVKDELRYGDVLVYPGHAAIYIGNGQTAETVSSGKRGVGKSTVWRRTEVVVRRFLNVVAEHKSFASRGGKPPARRPAKSTSAHHKKKRS